MPAMLKVKGLGTFHNELGLTEGTLLTADNIVIDRNDVARPRRGLADYGTAAPCCGSYCQLLTYKDRILAHDGTKLYFDNETQTGCWAAFSGCFAPTDAGLRIKSVESNGNFYFTTDDGIKKISGTISNDVTNFKTCSGFVTSAGGVKALDTTGIVTYECGSFLKPLSKTAYRVVWGIKDNNKNLVLGSPSSRFVISNTDCCAFANVCVTFTIPQEVTTTDHFYQIYRTGIVCTPCAPCVPCLEPGDEMNLVFEAAVTSCDMAAGTITIKDNAPDCFRESGVLLYTNPVSGSGILQANEKPPVAKDVELFACSVFFSNTQTIQRKQFNFLSVSALTSGQSKFVVANCTTFREYTFRGASEIYTITTVANVTNSLNGDYILVNSASDEKKYFFWFESIACTAEPCACDTAGRIAVKVSIGACDADTVVATALQTSVNGLVDFSAPAPAGAVITVTNAKNGNVVDATNGATSPAFTFCVTTQGDGECTTCNDVLLSSLVSPAQSIDETARSLVNIINQDDCGLTYAYYLSSEDDLPGIILLEGRNLSDTEFYIAVEDDCTDITAQFNPKLDATKSIASMACGCTGFITVTAACHGFLANDCVLIYNTSNCIEGIFTASCITTCTFKIPATFCATSTGRVFRADEVSDNDVKPNRLFYSKAGIPEAVPLVNFIDIGAQDSPIERILSLRDGMYILKEEGVFRLSGSNESFSVVPQDDSANIIAPDSAVVLNNAIYMLSTQGVAAVSDTGVEVISRPIEDKILEASASDFCFRNASFGVGYESDRSYILWLPSTACDTVATQAFRYNSFNKSWVRWTFDARAGVINPVDSKLYISDGDTEFIRQERKNNDRTDYADKETCNSVPTQTIACCVLELAAVSCINIADVIVQTQFVTIAKFNRLLRKLDLDAGLGCCDYTCSSIAPAACLASVLCALVVKIALDDCVPCYTTPTGSTFVDIQTDFNTLAGELNSSTKTSFSDYATICCATPFEVIVTGTCESTNMVCIAYTMPFVAGPVIQFQGITSVIEWAPQHFGDPSVTKQISEGTVIFDSNNFFSAKLAFATDLSKDFCEGEFFGKGVGFFGGFDFGCSTWGGDGSDVPYRTLIPRQKQRCRYITVKFTHENAREDFTILGISLKPRGLSTRGYRDL
jgi:hypothetical protein